MNPDLIHMFKKVPGIRSESGCIRFLALVIRIVPNFTAQGVVCYCSTMANTHWKRQKAGRKYAAGCSKVYQVCSITPSKTS